MFPIVERELRVASRKTAIYRARAWTTVLSGGLILFLLLGATLSIGFLYRGGQFVFSALIYVALIFCLLESVRKMADSISSEKREGTLGLLFLTDLKGHDIIFGKLTANSLRSFHVLFAFLPVLAITLLLGGVTPGEFARASVILVNALFVSLAAGLWVSTISRERSTTNTLGLLFLVMIVPRISSAALGYFNPNLGLILQAISPFGAFSLSKDGIYDLHADAFWQGVLILHASGWVLLLHASWLVPRVWQDKPVVMKEHEARTIGSTEGRLQKRRKLLDKNPVLWLMFSPRDSRRFNLLFFALFGFFFCAALYFNSPGTNASINATGVCLAAILLEIFLASQSSRHFAEARRNGAFELVLSTPITIDNIINGQWAALLKMFLPGAILLFFWFVYIGASFNSLIALSAIGIAHFLFALPAIGWFGMWMGVKHQNANAAFFRTMAWILIVPILSMFFCCPAFFVYHLVCIAIASSNVRREFGKLADEKLYNIAHPAAPPILSSRAPPKIT
jgi:ABC-type transport system involved in multi-copper enzyme maturation permease subunit